MSSGSLSIDNGKGYSGFKAHEYVAHSTKVNCVAIGPHSGAVLATGGDDKRVNVWKIGRASHIWSLTGNSTAIESVCFDPCEELLFSGSSGGAVKLYDLTAGKVQLHFELYNASSL
jgi:katanin p80 WD40 repeat-containing subunit B1